MLCGDPWNLVQFVYLGRSCRPWAMSDRQFSDSQASRLCPGVEFPPKSLAQDPWIASKYFNQRWAPHNEIRARWILYPHREHTPVYGSERAGDDLPEY